MKKIQVILLQRMKNLGFVGDLVAVKPGYARNFLFPKKIALRATEENKAYFEEKRGYFEEYNREKIAQAEASASEMEGYVLTIVRRASTNGHLYGSVSARDLVDYLSDRGVKIKQHQIVLTKPLKEIGVFPVPISFHADIETNIYVNIARSEQEAEVQMDKMRVDSAPTQGDEAKSGDANQQNGADKSGSDQGKSTNASEGETQPAPGA